MSAALDGWTHVMVFVYTFAVSGFVFFFIARTILTKKIDLLKVGGGSGTVRPFPIWALVGPPIQSDVINSLTRYFSESRRKSRLLPEADLMMP